MKKQISLFVLATVMAGVSPAIAATNIGTRAGSSADLTNMPATRERVPVNYEKYETRTTTRTYTSNDGNNLYYTQPANRSALYKQYQTNQNGATTTVRTSRADTVRTEMKRKYYLAHPFYQPLQGKVGSVSDLFYTTGANDFSITDITNDQALVLNGLDGKMETSAFSIKEDLSYGITDRFAIIGMLRYDFSDQKFELNGESAKTTDNDLNVYGIGLRWRFVDTDEWIATITPQYQRHNNKFNFAILDAQVGYKIARSTIYGLARGWYGFFDEGKSYGFGTYMSGDNDGSAYVYIPYRETKNLLYVEGGAGVFSVLDEDWTLNLEGTFGHYDWHNQLSVKGAIGWQPNDWFALNLYGKIALYDSANGQTKTLAWQEVNGDTGVDLKNLTNIGAVKLDNSSEASVGVQVMFEF